MADQLVRLHLPYRGEEDFDRWADLELRLGDAVERAGAGELDGNEIGDGEYTVWLVGESASRLAQVVTRYLVDLNLPPQCYLTLTHGDAEDENAREETITVS